MPDHLPIWDVPLIATVQATSYAEAMEKVLALPDDPAAPMVVVDKPEHDEHGYRVVRLHNESTPASAATRPR